MSATIVLVGRIVGDIETRQAGQSSVTRVRIPTDAGWGDSKQTTWWSVELWGKRGETLAQHGSAGDIICVTGRALRSRIRKKTIGTKGYSCDIKKRFMVVRSKALDAIAWAVVAAGQSGAASR